MTIAFAGDNPDCDFVWKDIEHAFLEAAARAICRALIVTKQAPQYRNGRGHVLVVDDQVEMTWQFYRYPAALALKAVEEVKTTLVDNGITP